MARETAVSECGSSPSRHDTTIGAVPSPMRQGRRFSDQVASMLARSIPILTDTLCRRCSAHAEDEMSKEKEKKKERKDYGRNEI